MNRVRAIFLVLLILALATLACGLDLDKTEPAGSGEEAPPQPTEAPAEAQPPAAEEEQAPAAEEAPEATEAPAEGAKEEVEEAELDLGTSISGLENLNSYRSTFRIDWTGTKGGQPVTGYLDMRGAYVRDPAAQEIHFEGQGLSGGEDQGLGSVSFIQVGDTAWFYESESDTWAQLPAGSLDFAGGFFFAPEDLLSEFDAGKGRRSLLPKQVNGVQCYKYTFDETDFDPGDLAEGEAVSRADGEVYVAVDGGYVVRFVLDADTRYADAEEIFEEGTITMAFDVFDINQPITIEPPAEAEAQTGGRDDIPMLPDAQVGLSSAEFITYETATGVEEAAKFYETEMPKNGWTTEDDSMVMGDVALLSYRKGDVVVNIAIGNDEGTVNVTIAIGQE